MPVLGSPSSPNPFSSSAAYRELRLALTRLLERDIDGDGHVDVVAVQRVGPGFTVRVVWHRPGRAKDGWVLGCIGPVLLGDEVAIFRWVPMESGELLLIVAEATDPDEVAQSVALVDVGDGCKARFSDRIVLPKSDVAIVAPGPIAGGVVVEPGSGVVRLVDEPAFLRLGGPGAEVKVLLGVRERVLEGTAGGIAATRRRRQFLTRRSVTARWRTGEGSEIVLAPVVDGDPSTAFVARAGEAGELLLQSDGPLLLLEFWHGCAGAATAPLVFSADGDGPAFVTGRRPPPAAPVRAAGGTRSGDEEHWVRDLVALRQPATAVAWRLGPKEAERCLREARAYGWAGLTSPQDE